MDERTDTQLSPYRAFSRTEWATLREDTPMTLTPGEFSELRSLNDRLDMEEVEAIYLPVSRLLSLYVAATQRLFRAQQRFLGTEDLKMPYLIGIAGSVAVGKSTTARVLKALLARWPNTPKVELITTDRFLMLRETAFRDPKSYFHRYSRLTDAEAVETATSIWTRINLLNLRENILPTRRRAHLILTKDASHTVTEVSLRRL